MVWPKKNVDLHVQHIVLEDYCCSSFRIDWLFISSKFHCFFFFGYLRLQFYVSDYFCLDRFYVNKMSRFTLLYSYVFVDIQQDSKMR